MEENIVIFEDEKEHQRILQSICESIGYNTLFFDTPRPRRDDRIYESILLFNPQLIITDSWFGDEKNAGLFIISYLQEKFPHIPIIVCSKLFFRTGENKNKYNSLYWQYKELPGVCAVFGKDPFPKGEDILNVIA